jgi:hypothetical protein
VDTGVSTWFFQKDNTFPQSLRFTLVFSRSNRHQQRWNMCPPPRTTPRVDLWRMGHTRRTLCHRGQFSTNPVSCSHQLVLPNDSLSAITGFTLCDFRPRLDLGFRCNQFVDSYVVRASGNVFWQDAAGFDDDRYRRSMILVTQQSCEAGLQPGDNPDRLWRIAAV